MKKFFFYTCYLITTIVLSQGQPINPLIMGQNYHFAKWTDPYGAQLNIFGDPLWFGSQGTNTVMINGVQPSHPALLRIGGKQFNVSNHKPNPGQELYYVSLIDEARKIGCEPVLTFPFLLAVANPTTPEPNAGTTQYTAAVAASIKTLQAILHLVNTVHKRNLRYVIIGNEYDVDYKWKVGSPCTNCPVGGSVYAAADVAANVAGYIIPMAKAIREMPGGSSIKIIGPEGAYLDPRVYDLLFPTSNLNQPLSIAGTFTDIAGSPPVIDFMSAHLYLYEFGSGSQQNNNWVNYGPSASKNNILPAVTTNTTSWLPEQVYTEIEKYRRDFWDPMTNGARARGVMYLLKKKGDDITSVRGTGKPLGWMITELNSSHLNGASAPNSGFDARTLTGAQNLARLYSLAMHYGERCGGIFMWSVKEVVRFRNRTVGISME